MEDHPTVFDTAALGSGGYVCGESRRTGLQSDLVGCIARPLLLLVWPR